MIGPGEVVDGRYRVERRLGGGGMAEVFAAVDRRLERPVALKVLRLVDPQARERFEREVRLLASLDHPGLVRLYDAGDDGADAYYVMELIDGPTLADLLQTGPLGVERTTGVGADLAVALGFIHDRGIVHRDLKPSNVLMAPDGRPRLADFGIARFVDAAGLTTTGITVGTAAYAAPEQISGGEVGPPADVYALGLVLAETVTGRRLFEGTAGEVLAQRLAGPPRLPDGVDPALGEVLTGMLARDPADRPTTGEVAQRLGLASGDTAVMAAPTGSPAAPTTVLPTPGATAETAFSPAAAARPAPGIGPPPRRAGVVAVALVAVAVIVLLIVELWPGSGPTGAVGGRHAGTSTTQTTAATTTTSTTAPTIAGIVSQLQQDVANGLSQGEISQAVANDLDHRIAAIGQQDQSGGGGLAGPVSDLAAFVAQHTANGDISPALAATLTGAIQQLAALVGQEQVTTSTAPPGPGPGPGGKPKPGGKGGHG